MKCTLLERIISCVVSGPNVHFIKKFWFQTVRSIGIASQSLAIPLNLAVLALLAVAILGNRYRLEKIIANMSQGKGIVFYQDLSAAFQEELHHKMEQSSDLIIMGASLENTLKRHYHMFEQKLRKGDIIRIVLVSPDGSACDMLIKRKYRPVDLKLQRAVIRSSLNALRELQTKTSGKLEVRVIDYPMTHGAIVVNPETSDGIFYLWHNSFKTHAEHRPKFIISPTDNYWYDYFKEEIYAIWNSAAIWQWEEAQK